MSIFFAFVKTIFSKLFSKENIGATITWTVLVAIFLFVAWAAYSWQQSLQAVGHTKAENNYIQGVNESNQKAIDTLIKQQVITQAIVAEKTKEADVIKKQTASLKKTVEKKASTIKSRATSITETPIVVNITKSQKDDLSKLYIQSIWQAYEEG